MIRAIALTALALGCLASVWAADAAPADDARGAILQATASYVEAFNKHDAPALAALWSETGVYVQRETGQRVEGRQALEKVFAEMFQEGKVRNLALAVETVRLVTPDVAVVDGTATVTLQDEQPSESTFSAVFVKKGGKWLLDSAHETNLPPPPTPYDHLKALEWLVGTWVDQSKDVRVETVCQWTANRTFLKRAYTVSLGDQIEHQGAQVIGWDPEKQCIRCWIFGSDGGFGEGTWTQDDNRWSVKLSGVFPDGRKGSATQIITRLDDNTMTTQMIGQEVDGRLLPTGDPVKVVRVPESQ